MKRTFLYASLLLAVVVSGCRKDEPTEETKKTPVSFVVEGPVTRTVTNGNTTTFVKGDQIGISSSGLASEMSNEVFTVAENGSLAGKSFYYDDENPATFYAHYPYTAVYDKGTVEMTVSADQSTAENFNANDFMTATAVGDPVEGGMVVLKFYHRLTLVKVVWGGSLTTTSATINNVLTGVRWTQGTNELTTSGKAASIKMWQESEDNQEYWALIPAQTVKAGTELVTINDVDDNYTFVTESDITFNSNTTKKISLTVKPDGSIEATVSELDIENWNDDDEEIDGEADAITVALITEEEGQNITLTPNSKNDAVEGAWNVAVEAGNIIEVDEDGYLHFNIADYNEAGNESKWWNNALYFRPTAKVASNIKPKIFKLTFEAWASEPGKGFMVQVMKGDESANTYFGITNTNPIDKEEVTYNRMYYPSFKAEQLENGFVKMTYWVNFGQIIDAAGTTVTEAGPGDYEKVLLTLSINTGTTDANAYGVDFLFRNFKFMEVKY